MNNNNNKFNIKIKKGIWNEERERRRRKRRRRGRRMERRGRRKCGDDFFS